MFVLAEPLKISQQVNPYKISGHHISSHVLQIFVIVTNFLTSYALYRYTYFLFKIIKHTPHYKIFYIILHVDVYELKIVNN